MVKPYSSWCQIQLGIKLRLSNIARFLLYLDKRILTELVRLQQGFLLST